MNRKIGVMFLSTVLPTALVAGQNGLTSDILNQANSEKADSAAFEAPVSVSDRMLRATAANETASLVDTRSALVADKFSNAETRITNEPESLKSSLSSGSTANEAASLVDTRSALVADKFSNAETRITNEPESLKSSLSSGSNVSRQGSEQRHDAEQPESFVQ
jgi:hypothetical protein